MTREDQNQVGDLRAEPGLVQQRLQLAGRNRGTELPGRRPVYARGPSGEQPPGRLLAEPEREQQAVPPGHDTGGVRGEVPVQFGVGQHDLHRVHAPGPADAGLGADDAGRAVAAGQETAPGLLGPGRRPQDGSHAAGAIAHPDQLGAALDLNPALGEGRGQHLLHVHLPDQRQVREGGVRQRQAGQGDPADPGAELQVRCRLYIRTGQQCLRHPKRAQHLERAGVHDQRPGGPDRLRPPVDDPDDGAVVVGLQGQRQAGRARAGHQDVGRFPHTTPVRCHHPAAAPVSSCGRTRILTRQSASGRVVRLAA